MGTSREARRDLGQLSFGNEAHTHWSVQVDLQNRAQPDHSSSPRCGRRFGRTRSNSAEDLANFGHVGPNLARLRPNWGASPTDIGLICLEWANLSRISIGICAEIDKTETNWGDCGRTMADFDQLLDDLDHIGQDTRRVCYRMGQLGASSAILGPMSTKSECSGPPRVAQREFPRIGGRLRAKPGRAMCARAAA